MKPFIHEKLKGCFQFQMIAILAFTFMSFSLMANSREADDEQLLSTVESICDLFEDLGAPHHITYAVKDLDAVKSQFIEVTGWEFREVEEETKVVYLEGIGLKVIHFRKVYSKPGFPFVEIVEANPPIGPWEATETDYSGYLGYAVDHVLLQGLQLKNAGFKKIAQIQNKHVIYETIAGVRVELVQQDLVPETEEAFTPQAPITLGSVYQTGWLVNNENIAPLKQRFSDGIGIVWPEDLVYPDIPFYFTEASGAAVAGIYPSLVTLAISVDEGPEYVFESLDIDLDSCDCNPPKDPCKFLPFDTSPTHSRFKPPAWSVPGAQVNDLIAQWENAGLELVFNLDIGTGAPILSYYIGVGGIMYEISNAN